MITEKKKILIAELIKLVLVFIAGTAVGMRIGMTSEGSELHSTASAQVMEKSDS